MHSKINQAKIHCFVTCQYRQKHVDHAQLRTPADTLSSWYVPIYANTRLALDMCLHMQKHFTPSLNASRYAAFDTCRHMQIHSTCVHAQHLIPGKKWGTFYTQMHAAKRRAKNANWCSSPWYKPTNAGTCSALCVQTPAIVSRYIHSLWCLQTQADTWHNQPKSMLICAKS
jgi:hypothetical protein